MNEVTDKTVTAESERDITVVVDRRSVTVPKDTTPGGVLVAAGLDPSLRELVRVEGKHQTPFPDPNAPLQVHPGETFVTVSTGPTPVS